MKNGKSHYSNKVKLSVTTGGAFIGTTIVVIDASATFVV
jgi:hypothetical protein